MAEDEAPVGGTSARAAEASILFSGKQPASGDTHRIAKAIKIFARLAEAPEVSSLSVVVSAPEKVLDLGIVDNADRNLLLITLGSFGCRPSDEYYLIFNAWRNSLTVIPKPPIRAPCFPEASQISIGDCGAVILLVEDEGEGACYILAELKVTRGDWANGTMWLWKSKDETRWIPNKVAIPVLPSERFYARKVFSLSSSYVCWVDHLMGVLICDVTRDYPELRFIPLPEECLVDLSDDQQSRPRRFRTMAAVRGIIKFVSMDGYLKGDVTVTIWTLNLESGAWSKVRELSIQTLWKNEVICANGLEGCMPMCPVLNGYEDDTVYFLVKKEPALKYFTYSASGKADDEKHYMIGVNMINSEVHVFESSQKMVPDCVVSYLTSCFPEYLYSPNKVGVVHNISAWWCLFYS
nr:uncharacterized protein LOC117844456 [Setaria viridis]